MTSFSEITARQAWKMQIEKNAILVDIRDSTQFNLSHPKNAFHLTNQSYNTFQQQCDYDRPVIVVCYHGVSSLNTAAFLIEQGYERVYSLIGGFDSWVKNNLPTENESKFNPQMT
ncbi:thiosulfate sulfurtransferase GlpE [Seminibacterium arietis]|uniref:Thiosulfate sulfurtransferase GlpE n=1 Tax=Seminibacterium arietis TaxID=1173502 RepID=A0ABW3I7V2_9PAST